MTNKFRLFPHPIFSMILFLTWLMLNNTVSAGHIVLGAFLATFIPWFTQRFWPEKIYLGKWSTIFKFSLLVGYDIIISNIFVAKLILGKNSALKPDFLEIPLDIEHPLGLSILTSTISLTPGTVSVDLNHDRDVLIVHALHVDDVEAEIQTIKSRYEKPLMEIFRLC
ncbi:MAG TPA: Na+/H+ antiporter subunit E [Sulfurovum sp.]|nr:Na+/H+ antiporter subunit E [Sulfurovum sp.]